MFWSGKKVLVTGATGLIGANVIEALIQRGAKVRGALHIKPPVIEDKNVEYRPCELTRREDCLAAVEGVEFVFHCAGNTSGALVMTSNPVAHVTENLLINAQLLEASARAKVTKFLFLSSTTLYPPVEHAVKEEEAFIGDPFPTYFGVGWMKRYIEKLSEFYFRQFGLNVVLLRPTNVFGPHDKFDFKTSHVLPALMRRAVEKQNPFEVWGDGTAVRDFLYVSDMIEAMLASMERVTGCEAINIGRGQTVTIRESVELILKLAGHKDAKVVFDASKPSTIPVRRVDLAKARRILNFQPKVSFEEGLKRTIEWYRSTR